MDETEKRKAIHEFFIAPKPELAAGAITIGAILLVVGLLFATQGATGFGGFLMLAGAGWGLLLPVMPKAKAGQPREEVERFSIVRYSAAKARYDARPSADEMVEWLREDLARIAGESGEKLGLSGTSRDPIVVVGSMYQLVDGFASDMILRRRVGEHYFYSTYRLSVFQFAPQFLAAYQCTYNMIKNVSTCEQMDEFFYRDVVAVRVTVDASSYTLKTGEKLEHSKTFSLTVSAGDRISVVINDPKICALEAIETIGDDAIRNVRAMVRQYKEVGEIAV